MKLEPGKFYLYTGTRVSSFYHLYIQEYIRKESKYMYKFTNKKFKLNDIFFMIERQIDHDSVIYKILLGEEIYHLWISGYFNTKELK